MDRVNYILNSPKYKSYLSQIEAYEVDRIYCRHDLKHFLDVARIAYIMVLEENIQISKEVVYAAAILHDIGRFKQYEDGTPHHEASYDIAKVLLKEANFNEVESDKVLKVISNHRNDKQNGFGYIFYKSDKISRDCYACKATATCNWDEEKRNYNITY
ncbi:HD domain-containing protein [Clostridium sp. YIM B02505]|uniref:HD domain-containing protein n=1 Tax=Clostridium yunnanense TaxID=2800325 RepID=A0ABS1EII6_9CLOT|nr:HD domain-containing protein [Clostridium yunnanense]MBK1809184.1 HD domain-containing protein [Clostridium yunnanense]